VPTADSGSVSAFYSRHCGWWDWRLSSRFRAASLGSLWLLLVASPVLGWFLIPLAALRSVAGLTQLVLNHQLGRVTPLGRRDRLDWALLALTLLASCGVAQVSAITGREATWMLIPVALPFSALQLRTCLRSERVHRAAAANRRTPAVVRFPLEGHREAA